jgi:predicted dehydrogenase
MVARVHVDAARRAGAVVVGVSASTPERGRAAAAEFGVDRAFSSSEELVTSPDVDVVHICTPNDLHRPLTEQALRAGRHVICEKPLATTGADARALAELAADAGVVTAVPFVYRYHPMAAEARARARSGELGPIHLVHGHYLQDWLSRPGETNWRVDASAGGASRTFADIGSHWCDLVEWVTGHRITHLAADTTTVFAERPTGSARTFSQAADSPPAATAPVTTEDAAHVLFRTDRGAGGTLVASQVSPGRKNRLWFEVDGAEASVVFDQENPESLLVGRRHATEVVVRDAAALHPEAARLSVLPAGHPMGYHDCFTAFVRQVYDAVRGRADATSYPTFGDAARAAALTDAVLTAARTRTWTEVSR